MSRRASIIVLLVAACGVEIGEPPEISSESGKDDGPGTGSGSNPGPTPLSATTFLTTISTQFCNEVFRCKATFPNGAAAHTQRFGATAGECLQDELAFFQPTLVEQSIKAGRVIYNPGAAQMCADGIAYQPNCAQFWQTQQPYQVPPACNTSLLGTIPNGGTCVSEFDCSNATSFCDDVTKKCVIQ